MSADETALAIAATSIIGLWVGAPWWVRLTAAAVYTGHFALTLRGETT